MINKTKETRLKKNQYLRNLRRNNPTLRKRHTDYKKRWYQKNKNRVRDYFSQWKKENKGMVAFLSKKYRQNNPIKEKARYYSKHNNFRRENCLLHLLKGQNILATCFHHTDYKLNLGFSVCNDCHIMADNWLKEEAVVVIINGYSKTN